MSSISERLNEALESRGFKAADLAKACGVYNSTVHGWLKLGKKPGQAKIIQIADFLKINFEWLTTGQNERDSISHCVSDYERGFAVGFQAGWMTSQKGASE